MGEGFGNFALWSKLGYHNFIGDFLMPVIARFYGILVKMYFGSMASRTFTSCLVNITGFSMSKKRWK